MKTIITIAALALTTASPVLAQTQLERSVGAEAGQYTVSQLALLAAASTETGNDARVNLDNQAYDFSTRNAHNPTALAIFADLQAASLEDEN